MLRIRLTRTGKKNRPYFRVVVAEHSRPVKGKFIEILGHYDPLKKKIVFKKEQILEWLKKGAKPSNTVSKLLTKQGMKHKSIIIQKFHKKSKKGKTETPVSKEKPKMEIKKDDQIKTQTEPEAKKNKKDNENNKEQNVENQKKPEIQPEIKDKAKDNKKVAKK